MARHKQIQTEEQEDPEMNISSMIDCCFLLLIYFLVATSLVSEKKLDISIPASETAASAKKPPVDPSKIFVKADGSITVNGDMPVGEPYNPSLEPGDPGYRGQRQLDQLVEYLKTQKDLAESVQAEPIVMLTGAPTAPHQRIVDVMAALATVGIHSVGISTADPDAN